MNKTAQVLKQNFVASGIELGQILKLDSSMRRVGKTAAIIEKALRRDCLVVIGEAMNIRYYKKNAEKFGSGLKVATIKDVYKGRAKVDSNVMFDDLTLSEYLTLTTCMGDEGHICGGTIREEER